MDHLFKQFAVLLLTSLALVGNIAQAGTIPAVTHFDYQTEEGEEEGEGEGEEKGEEEEDPEC